MAGLVACSDVLRRVIGAVSCCSYDRKLADYFQLWELYGVALFGGLVTMALVAVLGIEEVCVILSCDGATNVLNRVLPVLAEIVPAAVLYAANLYAREPTKLLFALDGGGAEVVESGWDVQQGSNLAPPLL